VAPGAGAGQGEAGRDRHREHTPAQQLRESLQQQTATADVLKRRWSPLCITAATMLAPAQGRADFIFQDLTTFNLGRFDGPTDLTFSPSAIFISH
jgi:hypothetical protein